jgi:hypothetical protein
VCGMISDCIKEGGGTSWDGASAPYEQNGHFQMRFQVAFGSQKIA